MEEPAPKKEPLKEEEFKIIEESQPPSARSGVMIFQVPHTMQESIDDQLHEAKIGKCARCDIREKCSTYKISEILNFEYEDFLDAMLKIAKKKVVSTSSLIMKKYKLIFSDADMNEIAKAVNDCCVYVQGNVFTEIRNAIEHANDAGKAFTCLLMDETVAGRRCENCGIKHGFFSTKPGSEERARYQMSVCIGKCIPCVHNDKHMPSKEEDNWIPI